VAVEPRADDLLVDAPLAGLGFREGVPGRLLGFARSDRSLRAWRSFSFWEDFVGPVARGFVDFVAGREAASLPRSSRDARRSSAPGPDFFDMASLSPFGAVTRVTGSYERRNEGPFVLLVVKVVPY
jgi:hypothetical protein